MSEDKKKLFISLPMRGRQEKDIQADIDFITELIEKNGSYEIMPSRLNLEIVRVQAETRNVKCVPLYALSCSLEILSRCDAILMCPGWEDARGCKIEKEAAEIYGLEVLDGALLDNLR